MKIENKKWLLRVALAGALCLGVASIAKADARLDSLGADSFQIDDVDSIWTYANNLTQYKNTVDFRLNPDGNGSGISASATNGTNEWGGVIHDLGDDFGTIATYVNRPSAIANTQAGLITPLALSHLLFFTNSATAVGSSFNVYAPSSNLDVFWAKSGLGLHLSYGDNEQAGGNTVRSQVWGLSAGFDLGSFMSFQTSEFHVDVAEDFLTNDAAKPLTDDGVYTLKIGWEGQTTLNPNDSSHVFAELKYDNDSLPMAFAGPAGQAANDLEFLLGGNIKHNISEKGFVNTGLELEYDGINGTTNAGTDAWTLVWNGSVESALNSFLTFRAGLDKVIVNRTYTVGAAGQVDDSLSAANLNNVVSFNTGFSINAENWTIDTNLSVGSFDGLFSTPTPGQGILFAAGPVATITEADLRYKF